MMAVDTIYHHEPPRRAPDHGREGPLRLRADAHRPLHREHAAPVRDVPARQRDDAALGDQLRSAVRAHPAGPGGRRHRDRVPGVRRPDRRLPAAGRSGAPVRQAVLLRDRRDHPQPHPRPPVLRPDHRHPAGRRHHQDRAARLGQHRRRRGRHRVARARGHVADVLRAVRHPAARRRSSTRCGPPPWAATSASSARESPGSTSGSCAPTTSPTTCSSPALFDEDGDRIPDEEAYGRRWMRNRENHWWQDLGMQDAGWTYEFFDGSLLLHDEVSFADGLVQPNGPGYQALIVYQSELDRRRRRAPARLGPPGPEGPRRARRPRAEAPARRPAHDPRAGGGPHPGPRRTRRGTRRHDGRAARAAHRRRDRRSGPDRRRAARTSAWRDAPSSPARTPTC